MRPTFFFSGYTSTNSSTSGWTSSVRDGAPRGGRRLVLVPDFNGSFGVGPGGADEPSRIAASGCGARHRRHHAARGPANRERDARRGGWHVSDVAVTWDVQDPDSPVSSRAGCDSATVATDTAGDHVHVHGDVGGRHGHRVGRRQARHHGARGDVRSPPQVFEIYQLGAWVSATVADATSGPGNGRRPGRSPTPTRPGRSRAPSSAPTGPATARARVHVPGRDPGLQRPDRDDRRERAEQRHQRHRRRRRDRRRSGAPTRSTVRAATT